MFSVANKFYGHMNEYGVDRACAEGRAWYPDAWRVCQEIGYVYDIAPRRVAAVMAVTSPRARWSTHVEATRRGCADHKVGT